MFTWETVWPNYATGEKGGLHWGFPRQLSFFQTIPVFVWKCVVDQQSVWVLRDFPFSLTNRSQNCCSAVDPLPYGREDNFFHPGFPHILENLDFWDWNLSCVVSSRIHWNCVFGWHPPSGDTSCHHTNIPAPTQPKNQKCIPAPSNFSFRTWNLNSRNIHIHSCLRWPR